jgi:hypothetical protein
MEGHTHYLVYPNDYLYESYFNFLNIKHVHEKILRHFHVIQCLWEMLQKLRIPRQLVKSFIIITVTHFITFPENMPF